MKIKENIKYCYYSRKYKRYYKQEFINKLKMIKGPFYVFIGRKNGKTTAAIRYVYIKAVEAHEFKAAKEIKKHYKKIYHRNIF